MNAWSGPPENELGVAVPVRVELARSEDLAFALVAFVAYSVGFEFTFTIRRRVLPERREAFPRFDELLLSVWFADGSGAVPGYWVTYGGGRMWSRRMGVLPLPPPGPIAFSFEWPAGGVPEARGEIEAQAVLDAATRVQQLWPDTESVA